MFCIECGSKCISKSDKGSYIQFHKCENLKCQREYQTNSIGFGYGLEKITLTVAQLNDLLDVNKRYVGLGE